MLKKLFPQLVITILVCICFQATVFSQSSAQTSQVNLDLTALGSFWEIYESLAADREPSVEQWDALFAKTGYATLEKRERRRKVMTEAMRIAYLPSRKTERDEILQNKNAYLKITVPNLLEVPKYRRETERFMQKENIQKVYLQAKKAAQEFLPAGTIKRFRPPPIAFIYFGSARGYDPMLFDPLYLLNHGNKVGLMGHEMHHYYRKFVAQESLPFGEDMLPWAIVNVENEGIPGRIDKGKIPQMSLAELEKIYLDKQTFNYYKEYQAVYANSNDWLKFSEKILEQIADNPTQKDELGKKLHRELPDNGRAMGTLMSEIIEKHFGRKMLNSLVGDAFSFWLTYNKAAKLSKGKGYILSDKAIKVIENTRDKYQK